MGNKIFYLWWVLYKKDLGFRGRSTRLRGVLDDVPSMDQHKRIFYTDYPLYWKDYNILHPVGTFKG